MFAGLDDITWDKLEHAYGPASDVPGLIRDLVSADDKTVDKALYELFGNIWHQGTVYPASALAVPFLAEALGFMRPAGQAGLLRLLASLAQGHGYVDVHQHLPNLGDTIMGDLDDAEATLVGERAVVRATTNAVFEQWDVIEDLLDNPDQRVQFEALRTLSVLGENDASDPAPEHAAAPYLGVRPEGRRVGEYADRVRHRAEKALARADDPLLTAQWLRALIQLGDLDHPALHLERAEHTASPLIRLMIVRAAAISAIHKEPRLPDTFAPHIAQLIEERDALDIMSQEELWPWDEDASSILPLLSARLSDAAVDAHVDMLGKLVTSMATDPFHFEALLTLILGDPMPRIPEDPCHLSPGRRELARLSLQKPDAERKWWFWTPTNGKAQSACRQFSLPHDREVWVTWLDRQRIPS